MFRNMGVFKTIFEENFWILIKVDKVQGRANFWYKWKSFKWVFGIKIIYQISNYTKMFSNSTWFFIFFKRLSIFLFIVFNINYIIITMPVWSLHLTKYLVCTRIKILFKVFNYFLFPLFPNQLNSIFQRSVRIF